LDWDDLRIFAELARAGSLSAAARRLKLDHSTVSRRLDALEAALGLKLLDRLPQGTHLTAEGERIAEAAGRMEEQAFLVQRLAQDGAPLSGLVRISGPPALTAHFLTPRLGPLRLRHPGIRLELIGETRNANLHRREADLALRLTRPSDESLVARKVGQMAYALFGTPAALALPRADWNWIGFEDNLAQMPQQRWLRELSGDSPMALSSNDQTILLAAVKAGLGVAALPRFLAEGQPELCEVEGLQPPQPREIWLVVHRDMRRSPRIRAVMDGIADALAAGKTVLEGGNAL